MTEDEKTKIEGLIVDFINKLEAINADMSATVIITHVKDALVMGNDHPLNALAAMSGSLNLNKDVVSAAEMMEFIRSGSTRH